VQTDEGVCASVKRMPSAARRSTLGIGIFEAGASEEMLKEVLEKNSYEKLSKGRKKGEEDTSSHYRKGVAGDWKNHFNERHIRYFKNAMNDILVKYGYEKDENW